MITRNTSIIREVSLSTVSQLRKKCIHAVVAANRGNSRAKDALEALALGILEELNIEVVPKKSKKKPVSE